MRSRVRSISIFLVAALAIGSMLSLAAPSAPVARAATTVEVCGTVTAYVKPTVLLAGAITIGGTPWVIAAGTAVSSDVEAGAKLCLRLTVNASGTITNLVAVRADATSTLRICGEVTAFARANATSTGRLTIGGRTLDIAINVDLPAAVRVGADLCATFELNGFGQIRDADVTANATSTVRICGVVHAFTEATATKTGSLRIGGRTFVVAIGADLPAAVRADADLCATLELNAFGQVQDGNVTANVTSTVRICGVVSAFAEATATKTGSLRIGERTFVVALGADLPASVRAGADLCATLELNAFGQVQDGDVTANVTSKVEICGVVNAFAEATATKTGSLRIDGRSFVVAMGADLPAELRAGADLCATLELNAFGQVQDGTVRANVGSTLTVCGQVTAFVDASANQNGSLTIGGTSKTISAGTNVDSRVEVGAFLKLRLTLNAMGRISDVTVLRVGASLSDACDAASPTPTPTPTPTPDLTPSPTPTPTPVLPPGPMPTPSPTPAPGATPTPTPDVTPTPDPNATPTPTPVGVPGPTPDPNASPTPDGAPGDVCPPGNGDGTNPAGGDQAGANPGAAPELPDTASAVERAGRVITSAAVPFMLFLAGIFVATAIAWWRRRQPEAMAFEEVAE